MRMRAWNAGTAALLVMALGCGEPTGPDALERSTFQGEIAGSLDRALTGPVKKSYEIVPFDPPLSEDGACEALGGDRDREGLQVTVGGDFRGYH